MSFQKWFITSDEIFASAMHAGFQTEESIEEAKFRPVRQTSKRARHLFSHWLHVYLLFVRLHRIKRRR